jgi:hypothetical protein
LGEDDAGLDGLAGGEASEQGVGEAWIEEGFANGAVEELARAEEGAGGFVGEADVRIRIDEHESVAEGVEEAVAFIACLFEIEFEAEFPGIDFRFGLSARAAVAVGENDQRDERRNRGEDGNFGDHASVFATQ